MKKISLKSVRETLTRNEMRMIAGGYGSTGYGYSGGPDRNCCIVSAATVGGEPIKRCGMTAQEASDASCGYTGSHWCCGTGC